MKGKLLLLTCTFFMTLILISSVLGITGVIGNARMVLYPTVGSITGASISKTILVKNINNVSINIEMVDLDTNPNQIDLHDAKFTLAAGEEKNASITIHVKDAGDFENKINIFFKPADGKGPGVVLSSVIVIHATKKGLFGSSDGGNNIDTPVISPNVTTNITLSNSTTSNNTNTVNNGMSLILVLGLSTMVLLIILILLIIMLKRRKSKNKIYKRSGRSS